MAVASLQPPVDPFAAILALVLVLVPGAGVTLLLVRPRSLGPPQLLALVFGAGYAVSALVAETLVVAHLFSTAAFLGGLTVVTAVAWAAAVRRGTATVAVATVRGQITAQRIPLAVGAAVVLFYAVARLRFSPVLNMMDAGPWRYWADGLEIAAAGQSPHATLQWGMALTPTDSKPFFNAFNAALGGTLPGGSLVAMGALLWVASLGFAVALWGLAYELGLRLTAPLLPLLVLTAGGWPLLGDEIMRDLETYKAEDVARMVAFCGLILAVNGLREGGRVREAALGGALLGVAAGTHLVPVTVMVAFVFWYAIARLVRGDSFRRLAVRGVAVVAVAAAMLVPFVLASSGDIGFQGAAGAGRYTSVFGRSIDPTVSFRHAREVAHHRDGHWYVAPRQLVELYGESLIGSRSLIVLGLFALAAVVVAVLLLLRGRDDVGVLGVVTTGLMGTFVVVALAFSWRYSTFIPAMFGRRRLYDYAVIGVALMGVVLAELGCRQLWRLRPWAPLAGASSLVAVAAIVALPQTHPAAQNVTASKRGLQALTWINSHVECDARILSSRRTAGSFETLTGRASIDEGMAPYLRPTILRPVLQNLIDIRRFFTDPAANSEFLRQHAVDYVIVFDDDLAIGDVPSGISSHVNVDALEAAPFLHEVANDAGMRVFRVTPAASPGAALRPSGFSGYTCQRGEAG